MNRIHELHELREQIDACRPGTDDLHLPELAELARAVQADRAVADELERSRRFDGVVLVALQEAPLPAGLLERLLAATKAAAEVPASQAQRDLPEGADAPRSLVEVAPATVSPAAAAQRKFSRRWLLSLAAVAAVALLTVGLLKLPQSEPKVADKNQLEAELSHWIPLVATTNGWTPMPAAGVAAKAPPKAFLFPTAAIGAKPVRWQSLKTADGSPMVAFDCGSPTRRATLFVVATPTQYRVAALPWTNLTVTGSNVAGAWQTGGLLYVLVVGDGQRLERYLARPSQA